MRARATSRSAVGAMNALEAQVGVGPAPRQVAPELGHDAVVAGGQPEGRVAVQGEPVAARDRRRPGRSRALAGRATSSTSRVSCLASSTLGWSNGSMPSTIPAIAVATSQRTASAPRSIGSDSSIRMTGWPAASRASASVSRPPGSLPASAIRTNVRSAPYASTAPSGSRSTGTMPTPRLPVLSAMSCSAHAPKLAISSSIRNVSLSRPALASVAMAMPERQARVERRVRLVAGAQHHRAGRQQRVQVDADERRRDQSDVGQRGIASADVGRVEEDLAEVVGVLDRVALAGVRDHGEVGARDARSDGAGPPRGPPRPAPRRTRGTRWARSSCPTSRR